MSHDAPRPQRERGRAGTILAALIGIAAAVSVMVWLRNRDDAAGGTAGRHDDPATQLAREMAAAHFAKDARPAARAALQDLVEREDPDPRDLIAAAIVDLRMAKTDGARKLLERVEAMGHRSPELDYNLALLAYMDFEFEESARRYRAVLEQAPGDLPTLLNLGQVAEEIALDADLPPEEAESCYRTILAGGVDAGAPWYRVALYKLSFICQRDGRVDEAENLRAEWKRLEEQGVQDVSPLQQEMGNFGRLLAPAPGGNLPAGPGDLPAFGDAIDVLPALGGQTGLQLADLDEDCRVDLVTWGPKGLAIALQQDGFRWEVRTLVEAPVERALAFDLGKTNDGALDLLVLEESGARLLRARPGNEGEDGAPGAVEWEDWGKALPPLPAVPLDAVAVDFDHEGDLDLFLVGEFGTRLWRDDGADGAGLEGLFTDVTAEAGLPTEGNFSWCAIEDFDTDQDVDLAFGGAGGMRLYGNLRGGRFEDESERVASLGATPDAPVFADLDGDARPDVWHAGRVHLGRPSGAFEPTEGPEEAGPIPPPGARVHTADLDLDGSLDVHWLAPDGLRGRQCLGFAALEAPFTLNPRGASPAVDARLADLDGDLCHDLVYLGGEALELRRGERSGRAVRLDYRGLKSNRRGIGAIVEVRAGEIYRRLYWRGRAQLVGLGAADEVDYVRVLWPNGVVQYDMRRALGERACDREAKELFEPENLAGSCPFLYTWNGERFEFISDVLGITPLGLPMAPGMLVPPDHDEYVLVRGEQLQPRDGVLELQFTEELREVTYLDRLRLDVVDHPEGTEVYPNELFCFPPFPAHEIHGVSDLHGPRRAIGSDGRDWSTELAAIDGEHAAPFDLAPSQLLGLATPHHLELEFDAEAVASAERLRLLMTGWFYWTDASVNMAAARDPRYEFLPPLLLVPDGRGGWRETGPPVGFPAGKTKTMVIDVGDVLVREDPRLRIVSTLRLYWDSIRLATDGGTVPLEEHSLEPVSAELWRRGFSAPLADPRPHQPARFEWEVLSEYPRWNPHPGLYTRYGETLPLLGEIDDRFVIMASGDALTVRFDANELPPLREGWRRDYLVFLDGWAKDRDPNTLEAQYVEPLPFHGMSGYPYGEEERFPDDEAHLAWRNEWNTRDAAQWIPLQPPPGKPPATISVTR